MNVRLTDKNWMLARARFDLLMDRRQRDGREIVNPCVALAVMFALVNRTDVDGLVQGASMETLRQESDAKLRTFQRALVVLVDAGLLEVDGRNRTQGVAKHDSTNRYRVDWEALGGLDGEQSTRHAGACSGENTRQGGACSGAKVAREQAPKLAGSGAKAGQVMRQGGAGIKEGSILSESSTPQPPAVRGEHSGGGGEELREEQATPTPPPAEPNDVRDAERILVALPRTAFDSPASDIDAALAAIRSERDLPDGATVDEIVAAAADYAMLAKTVRSPVGRARWLQQRRYHPHVVSVRDQRRRAEASTGPSPTEAAEIERQRLAEDRRQRVDAPLDALTDDQLEALRLATTASLGEFWRQTLAHADPRRHRLLREEMAAHLVAHGAPSLEREAVTA